MQNNQHTLSFLHTAARLTDVLETLDTVHNAASNNMLDTLNARGKSEIVSWLREIAYIANETIDELEQTSERPALRVIKGGLHGDCDDDRADNPHADGVEPKFSVLVANAPSPKYVLKQAGS